MISIVENIRADLEASVDKKTQEIAQKFFKEKIKFYGVKTPLVRKIAEKYWQQIKFLSKTEIFSLCEILFSSGCIEEAFVVSDWLPNMIESLVPNDLKLFKSWIKKYISNWAECDSFCNHTIGDFVEKYPETINEIKTWAKSDNRWLKRASAVSLVLPVRKGKFLNEAIEISNTLLSDKDDLVQKGYGWLLKEASKLHQKEVFDFIIEKRQAMPRTALRYAIELMPKALKQKAMEKI